MGKNVPSIYRGGLIGCGYASWFQLSAWSRIEGVKIVALSSRKPEKAEGRAAEFDIPAVYTEYCEMLDKESIDFVDIATPPDSHMEIVREAAGRKVAVLCQKPIAASLAEIKQMMRACQEAGVLFMVNENCRFQPWFRKMKALLVEGAIGEPFYARMHCRARGSLSPQGFGSQPFFARMPRLVIYEMGVHYLDTLRYLFGEAVSLFARTKRICADIAGEELAVITLQMNGLTAVVDMSWASIPAFEVEGKVSWGEYTVEGTKGTLHLQTDGLLRLITDNEERRYRFPQDSELLGYRDAQAHFMDCLRSGSQPETSGPETLRTMELVFGSYDSAAGNRVYHVGMDLERLK